MVSAFVLQRLLQIQAAGQVALGEVVAELRDAEQMMLRTQSWALIEKKKACKERGN